MITLRAPRLTQWRPLVRTQGDAVLLVIAAVVLVLTALPVEEHSISAAETDIFRVINDHTVLPYVVVWPIMQLGNIIAIPIAAAVAAVLRRWWLAVEILVAGVATYYLAKLVKGWVMRGRPATLLDDVTIRGAAATGRGYVSGHAAVITLLVVIIWPYLGVRWRWVAVAVAIFVCLARVYVGAHLPLDVAGGAALGCAVGAAARLIFGRPPVS